MTPQLASTSLFNQSSWHFPPNESQIDLYVNVCPQSASSSILNSQIIIDQIAFEREKQHRDIYICWTSICFHIPSALFSMSIVSLRALWAVRMSVPISSNNFDLWEASASLPKDLCNDGRMRNVRAYVVKPNLLRKRRKQYLRKCFGGS
jgi:hypothetical protein